MGEGENGQSLSQETLKLLRKRLVLKHFMTTAESDAVKTQSRFRIPVIRSNEGTYLDSQNSGGLNKSISHTLNNCFGFSHSSCYLMNQHKNSQANIKL